MSGSIWVQTRGGRTDPEPHGHAPRPPRRLLPRMDHTVLVPGPGGRLALICICCPEICGFKDQKAGEKSPETRPSLRSEVTPNRQGRGSSPSLPPLTPRCLEVTRPRYSGPGNNCFWKSRLTRGIWAPACIPARRSRNAQTPSSECRGGRWGVAPGVPTSKPAALKSTGDVADHHVVSRKTVFVFLSDVAHLMWFERLYVWLQCFEKYVLYPAIILNAVTIDAFSISNYQRRRTQ